MSETIRATSALSIVDFDVSETGATDICRSFSYYKKIADITNIEDVFFITFLSLIDESAAFAENERLFNFTKSNGGKMWLVVTPNDKNVMTQAEKLISEPNVVGIALFPRLAPESDINAVLEFTDRYNAVLLISERSSLTAEEILNVANKHKKTRFLLSLSKGDHAVSAAKASKHSNIYLVTDEISLTSNQLLEYCCIEAGVSDKLLFADGGAAFSYPRIIYSSLSEYEKTMILQGNAKAIFRKEPTQ